MVIISTVFPVNVLLKSVTFWKNFSRNSSKPASSINPLTPIVVFWLHSRPPPIVAFGNILD